MITLMAHQEKMAQKWVENSSVFNTSEPGLGKTIGSLAGYQRTAAGKLLVLAPLSILQASWGNDVEKFLGAEYRIAHGTPAKRIKAFTDPDAKIIITNHDAVNWIVKDLAMLDGFSHIVVDESTAFKNHNTRRSKALALMMTKFSHKQLLTGTPNPNTVLDLWHQAYLLDQGQRLGNKFFAFRASVCDTKQVGPEPNMVQYVDREGAIDYCTDKLKDIQIRFTADECLDLPENRVSTLELEMPPWLNKAYQQFMEDSILEMESGQAVTAVHASAKINKLLQLLSGAVYNEEGGIVKAHDERYQLVMELIKQRKHTVVGFNWKHQIQMLMALADKEKIVYDRIDGSVSAKRRGEIVDEYQKGNLQTIFAHPQSAGHGLTLTKGSATIWTSPTYNAEYYTQFNARIHRKGQTQQTETIRLAYKASKEIEVYEKLDGKLGKMTDLLSIFTTMTKM